VEGGVEVSATARRALPNLPNLPRTHTAHLRSLSPGTGSGRAQRYHAASGVREGSLDRIAASCVRSCLSRCVVTIQADPEANKTHTARVRNGLADEPRKMGCAPLTAMTRRTLRAPRRSAMLATRSLITQPE